MPTSSFCVTVPKSSFSVLPTSSFCVVSVQFLIVEEVERSGAVTSDPDSDDSDEDEDSGTDVRQFISDKDGWRLGQPKLILSVIYDIQNFFMNRRLLKSVLSHLVKAAAAEGINCERPQTIQCVSE